MVKANLERKINGGSFREGSWGLALIFAQAENKNGSGIFTLFQIKSYFDSNSSVLSTGTTEWPWILGPLNSLILLFGDSLVAQMVQSLPAMQETWVLSLDLEDLLEGEMATHSSILAWRIWWTEELGKL